jgi:cytoskeletal protein CcmA (bactofilin family)
VLGKTLILKGEVRSTADLTVEGRVEGPILCEDQALVIAASADVTGDVVARDIIVFGRTSGQLVATEVVDVRAGAEIKGRIVSRRFILDPAATFVGHVEPQHLEAALSVARFEQRKRDAAGASGAPSAAPAPAPSSAAGAPARTIAAGA